MKDALIYKRVSSEKQENGSSKETQEADCREYCRKQGYRVVGVYEDTMSGYDTLEERPGLRQARDRIQRGEAHVLIVWRFDRGSRDMTDALLLLREVTNAGGTIESATEGPVDGTAKGQLLLGVISYAAMEERTAIRERTHRAQRERTQRGWILVGNLPKYGYRYTYEEYEGKVRKASYEEDPETAPIVRRIFTMAHRGESLHGIVTWLNESHIPTPTALLAKRGELPGKMKVAPAWSRQMTYQLLKDPSYCGQHVAYRRMLKKLKVRTENGGTDTKRIMKERPIGDEKRTAINIPALVDEGMWNEVQTALHGRMLEQTRRNGEPDATLLNRGFVYCGECGARCIAAKHHQGYRVYQCSCRSGAVDDPAKKCKGGAYAVRASEVDQDTWEKAKAIAGDNARVKKLLDARMAVIMKRIEDRKRMTDNIQAELAEAKEQQQTLVDLITRNTAPSLVALYEDKLLKVTAHIEELEARHSEGSGVRHTMEAWLQLVTHTLASLRGPSLDDLTREERRQVLRVLGVKVFLYGTKSDYARANDKRWEFTFADESMSSAIIQE